MKRMKKFFRGLYIKLFSPYVVKETRLVTYKGADNLIKANEGWELSKQTDEIMNSGMLYVERREKVLV